jgi:hypothetical protein
MLKKKAEEVGQHRLRQGQTHQNNDFDFVLFLDWHF